MVTEVIAAHPDRAVISAHCRDDYGLDRFWRSLEMTPSGQRKGRSASGSVLTIWTRRIGQPDLFESELLNSSRALAVLDSNVVIDLYSSEALIRPDRAESQGLDADWVVDLLDLAVSPEVGVDLNSLEPPEERQRIRHALSELVPLRRLDGMRALAGLLVSEMPEALTSKDSSLANDAMHLADAVLAGADYFVTRDQNLIDATRGWIYAEYGVEVVRPADLLQRFIPPAALTDFRSDQLESVGLRWERITSLPEGIEDAFLDRESHEKGTLFRKQLQAVLARPATAQLSVLIDERGRRWALLGAEVVDRELKVSVVRAGHGRLGATIAFQLIRYLRTLALDNTLRRVVVSDEAMGPVLRASFTADGFTEGLPAMADLVQTAVVADVEGVVTPSEVAAWERRNWPQVVLERDIPVWVVPIQPKFARELIGYNDTLLSQREKSALGLSREFVYFAAPRLKGWDVPARVLWYVTKNEKAHEASAIRKVVAHSRIVDAALLSVEDALEQYRTLGVFREREIRERAQRGKVLVLRFEDTQELRVPIERRDFYELLDTHGVTRSLLTMRSAPPALFDDVLRRSRKGYEGG
ncbi:hypothetical protein GON06_17695 [Microbacterium sp. MAH-37]|nr:hypothetical protein [Microbacterium sp. MAH-37]MVQ43989.1 hypothetical protein [Microbacterium sp. MAH-37]